MKFQTEVTIGDHTVGAQHPVFVIAEAGVNHFGEMDRAFRLVDMAVDAGADAVKFQHFYAERMYSSVAPEWRKRMGSKQISIDQHRQIQAYCRDQDILYLCSTHDRKAFDELVRLDPPAHKIGSGEKNNPRFIERIARSGKPVVLSTGMYAKRDVEEALSAVERAGNDRLILLHCVTQYPTRPDEVNLRAMETLGSMFRGPVGYSDHTEGYEIVLASAARGARVIEKHIALERDVPGTQDPLVSCVGDELSHMVRELRRIEQALGKGGKQPVAREKQDNEWAVKSVVTKGEIQTGETITEEDLCLKRPGTGIPANQIDRVIGQKAKRVIEPDVPVQSDWITP